MRTRRIRECPECGQDISDTYESAHPDMGIMGASWYCDECEIAVPVDDEDDSDIDQP